MSTKVGAGSELLRFFILTFAITWGLQFPGVLAQAGILPGGVEPYMLLVVLGIFGPLVAAWIVTKKSGGAGAVGALFRSLYAPRPSAAWMLFALFFSGALLSAALALAHLFGREGPLFYLPDPPGRLLVGLVIAIAEEIGWRGFALPRLARMMGRLRASFVLGVIWTLWHIPMFVGQGVSMSLLPIMFVFFAGGSVVFSWFYFRLNGSLLIAVLLHLGVHLNNSHLALLGDSSPLILHTVAWVLAAVTVVVVDPNLWRREKQ